MLHRPKNKDKQIQLKQIIFLLKISYQSNRFNLLFHQFHQRNPKTPKKSTNQLNLNSPLKK